MELAAFRGAKAKVGEEGREEERASTSPVRNKAQSWGNENFEWVVWRREKSHKQL